MKRWKIIGGRRCLIKAGEPPYRQEAYNEKAATRKRQPSWCLIWGSRM